VREVIIGEFLARQQAIDETKTPLWTFAHGDGNCAVEFHDRRWRNTKQPVVERSDLAPVRGCCRRSLGVNCRNGRLQGVGAETARSKSALGERDAFGDLIPVPQRAILLLQQDQLSLRRDSSGAIPAAAGAPAGPTPRVPEEGREAACPDGFRLGSTQSNGEFHRAANR